jgi:multidrug resistance protein
MTAVTTEPSGRDPTRWTLPVLMMIVFIGLIGFGIVIPLLPFYAKIFDASAWQVTLMFATFSLGQFVGELVWGRLSDRIGRRPVLLITIFVSAVGYVALAFSPNVWVAIAARLFAGFFSGNISTIQGYIADVTPPEQRAGRMGLIGAAFGIGFVVGPALGGLLARPELGEAGFQPPLFVAAALCLVSGFGILAFVRESQAAHHRDVKGRPGQRAALRATLANPVLRPLLGMTLMSFLAFSAMQSTQGLWGEARFSWGPQEIGMLAAFSGLIVAGVQGLMSGRVVRRFGEVPVIRFGLLLASFSLLVQAFTPWVWPAVVCMALMAVGFPITQPAATSLISRATPPEQQGAIMGVNAAAGALARITGPIIAGVLFSNFGDYAPYLFASLGMLPAAWLAVSAGKALQDSA